MSTEETYLNLFHDYIQSGLQQSLERVRAAEPLVPEPDRQQAWHLLSYAFNVDAVWPVTRDLLLALAPKMEQAGLRDEWVSYLEQALHQSQTLGDRLTAAECQLHIGHLYRLVSKFDLARQWLTASVEGFVAQGDQQGQARALNQLAYVEYLQHNYAEANRAVEQAFGLLESDDPELAMSYFVQGMIAIDHEHWQDAEEYHRRSLILREKQGDKRRIAWSLQNLAFTLRGQRKFAIAISGYQQAITLLTEIGDLHNLAIVQINLGELYYFTQQPQDALITYALAESIFLRMQNLFYLAKISTNQGLAYLATRGWSNAQYAFETSMNLYWKLGDMGGYLNAMDGLAMTYLEQNLYQKASEILEKAMHELSQVIGSPGYELLVEDLTEHLKQARHGMEAAELVDPHAVFF